MIKKLLALCLLALACGGTPEDIDGGTNDGDLGTAEQAMNAPKTLSYVMGAANSASAPKCTPGNATQVCNVPTTRVFTWCEENLTGREPGWVGSIIAAGDSAHHFTWTRNPATGSACDAALANGTVNVMVNAAINVCASASTPNTNIETFVCVNPTVVTPQLAENPSVPGSFFGINGGIIHIDRGRLPAFFPTISQQDEVAKHGVVNAALKLEGIGTRSDANATFLYSRRQTLPLTGANGYTLTTGEQCTLQNYSSAIQPGVYAQDAVSCSAD